MVSEKEIARIREGLASGCILRPYRGVALGTPVRVLRGVFEGAEGVVTDFCRPCKVVMALSATGQSFTLEVDFENLEVLYKQREHLSCMTRPQSGSSSIPITFTSSSM